MSQLSFFNTTGVKDNQLDTYEAKAQDQESKILKHLRTFSNDWFRPEDIAGEVFNNEIPRSSLARSLANLTKKKLLIKSEEANATGKYGRPVHTWKYWKLVNTY